MVDMSLFARREFSGGIVAVMLWAFGLFGIYFFTSLYLQGVLGFSPTKAGAAFVPMALLMAASAIVSDRVAARFGAYRSTGFGMLAMGLGIGSIALLGHGRVVPLPDAELRGDRPRRRDDHPVDRHRARLRCRPARPAWPPRSSTPPARWPACWASP